MTYNEVVEYVKAIALDINPNGTFIHGRRIDGSIEYDMPMPQIHLYPFVGSYNVREGSGVYSIVMGFWGQDDFGDNLDTRQELIAAMNDLSILFMYRLETDGMQVDNMRAEPQYLTLSGTLSGYALTFNLTVNIECPTY